MGLLILQTGKSRCFVFPPEIVQLFCLMGLNSMKQICSIVKLHLIILIAARRNKEIMVKLVWSSWTTKGFMDLPYLSLHSFSFSK